MNVATLDTVGVRELKDRLSQYLAFVRSGGEVVITDHGRAVARVIGIEGKTSAERLGEMAAAGLVTPASERRRGVPRPRRLQRGATVSDLVEEQRR